MGYTFQPEVRHAKACSENMRISHKTAAKLCAVIRGKKLNVARNLLKGLADETRDLEGKHHTKTADALLNLLQSCEKNAKSIGLDENILFVHASAHRGSTFQRRRRKSGFGSRLKTAHVEIMLLERGKQEPRRKRN